MKRKVGRRTGGQNFIVEEVVVGQSVKLPGKIVLFSI